MLKITSKFDFVSRKIADGLDSHGMNKSHESDNKEGLAA